MLTAADYAAKHEIPPAGLKTEFRAACPEIVGPDTPEPPFPIILAGPVQKGCGRGGKDLGCPTGPSFLSELSGAGKLGICYQRTSPMNR